MKTLKLLVGSAILGCVAPSPSLALTGLEIMQEREKRHERKFEESWVQMKLLDRKGRAKKPRVMITWSKQAAGGLDHRLIKFAAPADIRGTGLLTWEQAGSKEDDQWLYLPASKQVKRIAGSGKKNQFMGTDLAYEDLRPENLSAHAYEISGEATLDGAKCWIITATPKTSKEKRESGYSKRVLYIRQDIYFTVKSEYYGRRGGLDKMATSQKLVKVAGTAWRSNLVTIKRLREGSTTILIHQKRILDKAIDATRFTQQGLKRPITTR